MLGHNSFLIECNMPVISNLEQLIIVLLFFWLIDSYVRFFNQIKHRIDYFLYFEGMYCMFCLVGRFSMTGFSSKIVIIPFIHGAWWGCYLWICLYDTWCDVSLIVEAQRIWICDPWIFTPLLHIYLGIWFLLVMILQVLFWVQLRCRVWQNLLN